MPREANDKSENIDDHVAQSAVGCILLQYNISLYAIFMFHINVLILLNLQHSAMPQAAL